MFNCLINHNHLSPFYFSKKLTGYTELSLVLVSEYLITFLAASIVPGTQWLPIKYCRCCSVAKSCLTLRNPMDYSCWASLSLTISRSLLKLTSIVSVMPPNHLILCRPFSSCLQSFPASGSFPVSWLLMVNEWVHGWMDEFDHKTAILY